MLKAEQRKKGSYLTALSDYKVLITYALSTFPLLRHLVQTLTLLTVPFSMILTFLRFGLNTLFVWIFEWLTVFPATVPLAHT